MSKYSHLLEQAKNGNKRALSKLISAVEGGGEAAREVETALGAGSLDSGLCDGMGAGSAHAGAGSAHPGAGPRVIGVTGPPGSGKSTLTNRLIEQFRRRGKTVGVIAVDPTSPFTGGAILGDRIRMPASPDEGLYIRSMGSRGAMGGLSAATRGAVSVLKACSFDEIIVESVGTGQNDIEMINHADLILLLAVPGLGDDIQSIKAGLLEIGDIHVVNKCDLPGADMVSVELQSSLSMARGGHCSHAPVVMVSSTTGEGLSDLMDTIDSAFQNMEESGELTLRRVARLSGGRLPGSNDLYRQGAALLQRDANKEANKEADKDADKGIEKSADKDAAKFASGANAADKKGNRMSCLNIDHIGIAVKDLEQAAEFYEKNLGIKRAGVESVTEQQVRVMFLPCGDCEVELLESTADGSAVDRFLSKNGEGVQHIAFRVDDIEAALADLREKGVRLIDETPRYGAGGARIAFIHPKATNGVLIELCERNGE